MIESISDRLLSLRKKHKLTQRNIAKLCNVTVATVSQWESGYTAPKTLHVIALADFFRTTVHYIALGVSPVPNGNSTLRKDELYLLNKFERASEKKKKIVLLLLDTIEDEE